MIYPCRDNFLVKLLGNTLDVIDYTETKEAPYFLCHHRL